ncbi:MAG: hypothetical protein Q9215_002620 [Flavoplaca cf. flavocitrina]
MDQPKISPFKLLAAGTAIAATCSLLYLANASKQVVPNFTCLPLEIRLQIYRYLLTSREVITKPDSLVDRHYIGVPDPRVLGLHVRILRSSRQIYEEALPVLYGENVFAFLSSRSLEAFQSKGLVEVHKYRFDRIMSHIVPDPLGQPDSISFAFKPAPYGRLTMMRRVEIQFRDDCIYSRDLSSKRESAVLEWRSFFNPYSTNFDGRVHLPALSHLALDFTGLDLGREGFNVRILLVPHCTQFACLDWQLTSPRLNLLSRNSMAIRA